MSGAHWCTSSRQGWADTPVICFRYFNLEARKIAQAYCGSTLQHFSDLRSPGDGLYSSSRPLDHMDPWVLEMA
jgi:hypothetical protein